MAFATLVSALCLTPCTQAKGDGKPNVYGEGYDALGCGATYVNTFKNSKGNPHKVVVFDSNVGMAAVDLDASTYNK